MNKTLVLYYVALLYYSSVPGPRKRVARGGCKWVEHIILKYYYALDDTAGAVVVSEKREKTKKKKKNLPKCRQIDSARAYPPFYLCAGDRARRCVRARAGCACGGRPGSTNSRRNARVYHAATAADDSVRGRFRRRPNVAAAAAGSSNPATQQKPLCVGGALERSLDRSFAGSSLFWPQRARRSRTTTRQCKRHDKNAAAARDRCETHFSIPPLFHGRHLQRLILCNIRGREVRGAAR